MRTSILVGTLNVGFLVAAILVTRLALKGEARIDAMGVMCAGLNIIMYASPLSAMVCTLQYSSLDRIFFLYFIKKK